MSLTRFNAPAEEGDCRPIHLSPPLRVPALGRLSAYVASRPRTMFARGGPSLTVHLEDALLRFPNTHRHLEPPDRHSASREAAEDHAHDSFFQVVRVDDEPCAVFARALLHARLILFDEIGSDTVATDSVDAGAIDQALSDICVRLFGARSPVGIPDTNLTLPGFEARSSSDEAGYRDDLALRRWIRGHQLFAVLTQGLIVACHALARALRADDTSLMHAHVDLCLSVFRGSSAALRFTSHFSETAYNDRVRPRMMPPAAPIPLSGLMSADHRALVRTMRDMKPAFLALRDREPERYQRLHDALSTVYDSHIYVCERFVGEQQSLLTAGRTEKSGPDLIRHFKSLRLKVLERDQRVEPLELDERPTRYMAADRPVRRRPSTSSHHREDEGG